MPKQSPSQRKSVGRVMHEFRHGELKSGRGGRAGKVRNPRQAIAIALHEAGASKFESANENRRSYARTKGKEARGETAQQESEGKKRVGARGRRESSRAHRRQAGGKNAKKTTRRTPRQRAAARRNVRKAQVAAKRPASKRRRAV